MSIFGRFSAGGGMVPQRTSPIRPGAEEYAFTLGLTPGGPGWGDAVRDYVRNGPPIDYNGLSGDGDEIALQEGGPVYRRGPITSGRPQTPPQRRPPPSHQSRLLISNPGEVQKAHMGTPFPRRAQPLPRSDQALEERQFPVKLSGLSERHEGKRGPATIAHTPGDRGGASYGSFQMTRGSVIDFLANEGSSYNRDFQSLEFGTPSFDRKWLEVVGRDPQAFRDNELGFILRTHYDPIVARTTRRTRLDLDTRSDAVRQAVWSTAVQFGGGSEVLANAVKRADKRLPRDAEGYDDALLTEIYRGRSSSFQATANNPKKTDDQRRVARNVLARYRREEPEARGMLAPIPKDPAPGRR